MTRLAACLAAAASSALAAGMLAPGVALGQVQNALDRARGLPSGLALPVLGVAAAEEPSGLGLTPAAAGFVPSLALQYFHEADGTRRADADGLYAATMWGPLGLGLSAEWIRPTPSDGPRYRKTTFALALGDARTGSLGVGWNFFSSRDAALDDLGTWDVGLTTRPSRFLSLGLSARGLDARRGGERLPVRWDVGAATRLARDTLTLAVDLVGDDAGGSFFRRTHVTAGLGLELRSGLSLAAQAAFPIRDDPAIDGDVSAVIAVGWNTARSGLLGGATSLPHGSGWLVGARSSSERYRGPGAGRAAPLVDVKRALSPRRTLFLSLREQDPHGELVRRLEGFRGDPEVAAVVLEIEALPVSVARIEELRAVVAGLRARVPVLAYLQGGGTKEYYLASAATAIAAPPDTTLVVNGFAGSTLFLKDALGKLGVGFEVVRAGAYKTAAEPLVRSEASPEAREVANAVLDDVFGRVVAEIGRTRELPEDRVRALLDEGLFTSARAKEAGLVDVLAWPDELEGVVRGLARRKVVLARGHETAPRRTAESWGPAARIALVRLEGMITPGEARRDPLGADRLAGADTVAAQLRRATDDAEVKAIVIRIESPGGDAAASDLVWRELVRARQKGKPVIASLGDVAASGGYLVAAGADAIVAEASTVTGSIGVFALKPDLSGLLGKLAVSREAYARGQNAEVTTLARPWSEGERAAVEKQVDAVYEVFLSRVTQGRRLPREEVERLAGGRVWTGRQALERGLVDRLGSLSDAIQLARERAGLGPGALVEVTPVRGAIWRLGDRAIEALSSPAPFARTLAAVPELRAASALSEMGTVLALPLEWVAPE
jgi:protease-4